ncbi:MAG: hypothetical protein [Malazfec virus 1]
MDILFNSCELGVKAVKKFNIGSCINRASSMFAVRSNFNKESEEYKELTKRIMLSQGISQSYIDYRKNGLAFEMPKHWNNQKAIDLLDVEEQAFNQSIIADKKPMFMKHLYTNQSGEQNDLMDMLNLKSIALWNVTASELLAMKQEDMTANQKALVHHFNLLSKFNFQDNSSMSIWGSQAEKMLKEVKNQNTTKSTGELLKSGVSYDNHLEKEVRELLLTYNNAIQQYNANLCNIESDGDRRIEMTKAFISEAKEELYCNIMDICENDTVATDVMVTVCYKLGRSCDLLFDLFGEQIYENVKSRKTHINTIVADENGDYTFKYAKYSVEKVEILK